VETAPFRVPSECDRQSDLSLNSDASETVFQTTTHSEAATEHQLDIAEIHQRSFTVSH